MPGLSSPELHPLQGIGEYVYALQKGLSAGCRSFNVTFKIAAVSWAGVYQPDKGGFLGMQAEIHQQGAS